MVNWLYQLFKTHKKKAKKESKRRFQFDYSESGVAEMLNDPIIEDLEALRRKDIPATYTIFYSQKSKSVKNFAIHLNNSLLGILNYDNMPWKYPKQSWWNAVAPYLDNQQLRCKVSRVKLERNVFFLRALPLSCDTIPMKPKGIYKAIVLDKDDKGAWFEMGHNFLWEYGSLRGFIPYNRFAHPAEYTLMNVGDEKLIQFDVFSGTEILNMHDTCAQMPQISLPSGFSSDIEKTEEKQKFPIIVGHIDLEEKKEISDKEKEALVATIQAVTVHRASGAKGTTYWLNGEQCVMEVTQEIYPNKTEQVRKYLHRIPSGEKIDCEILFLTRRRSQYYLKLSNDIVKDLPEDAS